jgi:FkbH-like protein
VDLDNTLWGGVIGDDGLDGIVLGQGSALGEAFVAFQEYLHQLSRRGVILAVCSKNDEANALSPFENHPEMVLKRSHFAAFVANWADKATNLRNIAQRLNIGLDSLVFVDDNPFERNLVRTELPVVAVPELPEDPAHYARCLADAGYFESARITAEDLARTEQYRANIERESLRSSVTDLSTYLESLKMEMQATPFDEIGLGRITQLINKTNQFNLTTRRYSEQEVAAIMSEPNTITLQVRLTDKLGDNGMISVVIAKPTEQEDELTIDTWLMSCRVLGRQVEHAVLNILADAAMRSGYRYLKGEFKPTAKNTLVKDHYEKLGFEPAGTGEAGQTSWRLSLKKFSPFPTFIAAKEASA